MFNWIFFTERRRSNSQDSDLDYVPRRRTKDISPDLSPRMIYFFYLF